MKLWSLSRGRLHYDRTDSSSPLPPLQQRQWIRAAVTFGRGCRGAAPGQPQAEVYPSAATQETLGLLRCGHPYLAVNVQRGSVSQNRWVLKWQTHTWITAHRLVTSQQQGNTKPQSKFWNVNVILLIGKGSYYIALFSASYEPLVNSVWKPVINFFININFCVKCTFIWISMKGTSEQCEPIE